MTTKQHKTRHVGENARSGVNNPPKRRIEGCGGVCVVEVDPPPPPAVTNVPVCPSMLTWHGMTRAIQLSLLSVCVLQARAAIPIARLEAAAAARTDLPSLGEGGGRDKEMERERERVKGRVKEREERGAWGGRKVILNSGGTQNDLQCFDGPS